MLAAEGLFHCAFGMILLGAIFDFFDGMSARALKVNNPIGKEIDSLADVITFGLAPSVMLMQAIRLATENSNYAWGWWSSVALIMAAFSALRLAKFNIDERQTSSFIGLATPANAIFWGALISSSEGYLTSPMFNAPFLLAFEVLACWLLVCEIPMFSLKFQDKSWANNRLRYVFLVLCAIILVGCAVCGIADNTVWRMLSRGIAGCIGTYLAMSIYTGVKNKGQYA